jgi:hypothetical protein
LGIGWALDTRAKKGCGGSVCFSISDLRRDPYREGGPVVHEQLRHIVAPQHIEKDYLDTRCSNRDATHRAPLNVGISTNYL